MFKRVLAATLLALGALLGVAHADNQLGLGGNLFQLRSLDNFNRANGVLSAPWTITSTANPTIASNLVQSDTLNSPASAYYSGTYSVNQYSQITVGAQATVGCRNIARVLYSTSGGTDTAYQLRTAGALGASTLELDKVVSNVITVLGSYSSTLAGGDVLRISAVNGVITGYRNSAVVGSVQDTSITTGNPGVSVFVPTGGSLTDCSFDNWVGGNVNIPSPGGGSPQYAVPTYVQGGSSFSTSYTFSQANGSGDTIVVSIGWDVTGSVVSGIADSKGNVYQQVAAPKTIESAGQSIWAASNIVSSTAGSNIVTVSFAGGGTPTGTDLRVAEYSGLSSSPFDVSTGVASTGTAMNSGATAATTQATELVVGSGYTNFAVSAAGSGFTQRILSGGSNTIQDKIVSSIGTQTSTETQSANGFWIEQVATFKAAQISGSSSGGSSSSSSSSSGGSSSSSGGITPLAYLVSKIGSGQVINGQWADFFQGSTTLPYGGTLDQMTGSTPATVTITDHTLGNTGLAPSILGISFTDVGRNSACQTNAAGINQTLLNAAIDYQKAGGMVLVADFIGPPSQLSSCPVGGVGGDFPNVNTPGTSQNNAYYYGVNNSNVPCTSSAPCGGMWQLAQYLKQLPYPFLYRPLWEGDLDSGPSGSFWWGTHGTAGGSATGGPSNAQYVTLFQNSVTFLRNQGVTGMAVVYDVNYFSGGYAQNDPGAAFRDVYAVDFYFGTTNANVISQLSNPSSGLSYGLGLGIPVGLGEVGINNPNNNSITLFSGDNSIYGSNVASLGVIFDLIWNQHWCLQCQNGAKPYMQGTISRNQLPAFTPNAQQTAFFVSPSGNDTNAGTLAAPFLTLGKAQTAMRASSTIKQTYVRAGTYSNVALTMLNTDSGENWSSYFSVDGYNAAIMDGGASSSVTGGNPITIDGGSNITINGFKIQNFQQCGVCIHGGEPDTTAGFPASVASTDSNSVTNNIITTGYTSRNNGWGGGGVWVSGNNTNLTIDHNAFLNLYASGVRVVKTAGSQDATNLTYTFSGLKITNNAVLNTDMFTGDNGSLYMEDFNNLSNNIKVTNNFIRDYQDNPSTQKNSTTLYRGVAIYLDSGTSNATISGNVIAATLNTNLLTGFGGTNAWYNAGGQNNSYSRNIIDMGIQPYYAPFSYDDQLSSATGNVFTQNILIGKWAGSQTSGFFGTGPASFFYNANYATVSHFASVSNNMYYNFGGGTILSSSNQAHGGDSAPVTGTNPLFAAGCLYALNSGSPALSAPLNFPAIVGAWGPPGYSVACGTTPGYQ